MIMITKVSEQPKTTWQELVNGLKATGQHTARATNECHNKKHIKVMERPCQSPDVYLIEN